MYDIPNLFLYHYCYYCYLYVFISNLVYSSLSHCKVVRSTTDDFATIPYHLVLISAVLAELAKSIPVHCVILPSYHFFCISLLLFPFTVPCRIAFAKLDDFETVQTILVSVS